MNFPTKKEEITKKEEGKDPKSLLSFSFFRPPLIRIQSKLIKQKTS